MVCFFAQRCSAAALFFSQRRTPRGSHPRLSSFSSLLRVKFISFVLSWCSLSCQGTLEGAGCVVLTPTHLASDNKAAYHFESEAMVGRRRERALGTRGCSSATELAIQIFGYRYKGWLSLGLP